MADDRPASISNAQSAVGSNSNRNVEDIPSGRPYRAGEVTGKKLPGYLVRSLGLLSHLDTPRVEWGALAIAAHLSDITEGSGAEAIRYRNRHTRTEHTVEREEGTIQKSRQSFVEDLRRRLYKRALSPGEREQREQWPAQFERDYDRVRHAMARLEAGEYLVNEGPAVEADNKPARDANGRRWSVMPELRRQPDADPQRRFVLPTGPEPEMDRDALHVDVLDCLERLVAYREDLHEDFTAGWKAEQEGGEWQKHQVKTDAARSHQWTARNGTDRPQYVSIGRWRPEEIEEDELKGERAVTIPWITFDIDANSRARCATLGHRLCKRLRDLLPDGYLDHVLVSYTGGSSVHIRVPAGFLGNPVYKDAEAAAQSLSAFADRLCEGDPELRDAIDDRLFHPRQMVRMIGSMYAEETDPPDNSSWKPWLTQRLAARPGVEDRAHAADIADEVLAFLRERHLDISDITLDFSGPRPVIITDAPDQTPRANRVVATTARQFLADGARPLWDRSEAEGHSAVDIPDPTEAPHVSALAALFEAVPTPHAEGDTQSVAKQPSSGEYERALQVDEEGEKWGRDVDKPHLVGRNRAALTISLHRLTYSETPWRDTCVWNRDMAEPLPEPELRKTFRSAKSYVS